MKTSEDQAAPSAPAHTITSSRYVTLPTDAFRRSADNPRDPISDTDPETLGLAESIRTMMQLEPVLARDLGEQPFEILAGERRWRACILAGKPIEARLVVCDDRAALQITVIENLQRKNLSALEEARGVATLLRRGYTSDDVCSQLGQTASWVEKRAKLVDLVPAWADHLRDEFTWAGIGHLEQIARLPSHAQEELAEHYKDAPDWDQPTAKELAQHIADQYLHQLKSAAWKLDDATLVPAVGACSACSRRSDCQTVLFADLAAKAGARCLDATCWYSKVTAQTARKAAELGETQRVVVIEKTGPNANPAPTALPASAVKVESAQWYGAEEVKKTTPGAVPVIDSETARVSWMKPKPHASTTVKRALGATIKAPQQPGVKPAATGQTAQIAAARRAAKRYAWRLQAVGKAKDKAKRPDTDRLLRLLAVLVIEQANPLSAVTWGQIESTKRSAADDLDALWEYLSDELPSEYEIVSSTSLPDLEAVQACEHLVGLRSAEQAEKALAQVPEPEPKGKRQAAADKPGSGKVAKPKAAKAAKPAKPAKVAKPKAAKAASKKRGAA